MEKKNGAKREWLIAAREKQKQTVHQAAGLLKISPTLLHWLEQNGDTITRPGIADRIQKKYRLSIEQRNDLVHEKYRVRDKKTRKQRAEYEMVNGEKI